MYAHFKSSKSVEGTKKLFKSKTKQVLKQNIKKPAKPTSRESLGNCTKQGLQANHQGSRKYLESKENIYYFTSKNTEDDDEQKMISVKFISKRNDMNKIKKSQPSIFGVESSQSSISVISIRKEHFVENQDHSNQIQINRPNPEKPSFIFHKSISPKSTWEDVSKNFSNKTSIKEISQLRSSHSTIPETPKSIKNHFDHPIKDKTMKIAMKNMIQELKETRQENAYLKDQLIKIKSQQFYYLDRQKVTQIVTRLEQEKSLRKQVEKENTQIKEENSKLKEQNSQYKKENIRMKRINAKMKDQIYEVKEENIILRIRANKNQKRDTRPQKETQPEFE